MKSSFLVSIVLSTLVTVSAFGQTARPAKAQPKKSATSKPATKSNASKSAAKSTAPTSQTSTQAVSGAAAGDKSSFDRFYERLSINYFGVFTSPTLQKWNSANAALSPGPFGQTGRICNKNCDTYAMNLWNQVNFAYDFGWKMKFVVIPRAVIYFNNPRDMSRKNGEDRAMIGLEDFLVGFAGTIFSNEDKKFNWFIRPAMRLPTSHFSRHNTNAAFGDLTQNLEIAHYITYDPNPQWQYGLMLQQRMWVYEDRYNVSRLRLYTAPYISYAPTEKTKVQLYYQNMYENNKRLKSVNGKNPVFQDYYQDIMMAVGHDITPTVNLMPYLGLFVNDAPLSMRSAYLGAWIAWKIK